jgi:hypothetical protein
MENTTCQRCGLRVQVAAERCPRCGGATAPAPLTDGTQVVGDRSDSVLAPPPDDDSAEETTVLDVDAARRAAKPQPAGEDDSAEETTVLDVEAARRAAGSRQPAPAGADQTVAARREEESEERTVVIDLDDEPSEHTVVVGPETLPGGTSFAGTGRPAQPAAPRPTSPGWPTWDEAPVGSSPAAPPARPASPERPTPAPRQVQAAPPPRPSAPPAPATAPAAQNSTPPARPHTPAPQVPQQPYQQPAAAHQHRYPTGLTASLTGALLGASAAPPRHVPKTSYRMVVPVLIIGLLVVIGIGALFAVTAMDTIQQLFDRIVKGG